MICPRSCNRAITLITLITSLLTATKVCVACHDLIHPPCCRRFLIQIGGKYWWSGYWTLVLGVSDPNKSYVGDIYFHPHHNGVPHSLFEKVPQYKQMYSRSGGHIVEAEQWLAAFLLVRKTTDTASASATSAITTAYAKCNIEHSVRFTHPHIMERKNVRVVDDANDEMLCTCESCSPPAPTSSDT